jgi:peptidyl-prolyl cis-trans isomerase A (cyclophilin A)
MALAAGTYAVFTTSEGKITVRLFEADAPITVKNFIELAEGFQGMDPSHHPRQSTDKLYDGTIFHRVIPDFMIQGGDPAGTGMGGPGYRFEDETKGSPHKFDKPGKLAMANSGPNTNGCQFFITVAPTDRGSPAITPSSVKWSRAGNRDQNLPRPPQLAGQAPQARGPRVGCDRARRLTRISRRVNIKRRPPGPAWVSTPPSLFSERLQKIFVYEALLWRGRASQPRRAAQISRMASPNFSTLAGPIPSISSIPRFSGLPASAVSVRSCSTT